ncbi:hypothetical protein VMCG_08220 [Cytospora schulzeri]|uniref:AB hydrolase-1 domain-containing protein n=1 Tax=Cytospora schulzeri TaxID=448051 RepID=A0A423VSW1_9PEZI|nr:hypothetical protein VMCG_08220 [Valsa malicola]
MPTPLSHSSSVLVVGAGTWGCSTALHLARRGYTNITVLDPYPVPSPISAGTDVNKIVELGSFSGDDPQARSVSAMCLTAAVEGWLNDPVFKPYFHDTGYIVAASSPEGKRHLIERECPKEEDGFKPLKGKLAFQATMPPGVLTGSFPDWEGFIKPKGAGWVHARKSMESAAREAERLGVKFTTGEDQGKAVSLIYEDGDIKGAKTIDGKEHRADRTLLCAGANVDGLFDFKDQLRPTAWTLAHIKMTTEEVKLYKDLPVLFNVERGFFMEPDEDNHELKFCDEHPGYCNWDAESQKTSHWTSTPFARHQIPQEAEERARLFLREHITWEGCGEIKGRPVECSTITVPMDQFNATNSGDKVFTVPLIRMRGKDATQNLLLNPGGPGGSGFEFLHRRGEQLSTIVGEGFHLLSFDPRGVNGSSPQALCYPDQETRRALGQARYTRVVEDSPEAYAFSKNHVRACADTMGEHGLYINTPQTAADMNSILDAVGQKDMVYWGFSYGTLLGQTYAGLFPERSQRVIIDGVVNQFDWYDEIVSPESLVDTENVMDGFFSECLKAGDNCTLSTLVESAEELAEKVLGFAEGIYEEPLSVYINNTAYGLLDYSKILFTGIFPSLYKPAQWYTLADRLARLLEGNATEAFLAYGGNDPWGLPDDSNIFVEMNDMKSGAKYWPQDRKSALDIITSVANESLFGPAMFAGSYVSQQWILPHTHSYVPKYDVKTAHPLLILSTTYDPVCPLISARSANKAFAGSQIVEVKGYGHCSLAVASTCLAKHVRSFLYNGTVPDSYTQCEVDGPYFIKPEEDGKTVTALKEFDDPEEMRIHIAQLELARDPDWPSWSRW